MSWCLFTPNTKRWTYYNIFKHGDWQWRFFDKWEGMSLGIYMDYYDGYHFSINTYIVNLYIYW